MNTQVKRILFVLLSALFLGPLLPSDCDAQEIDTSTTESAKVQLNFPDQTEVKLLVDYVSTRLGIKILFDESVANKKITIKAPGEIPADTLLGLLESALKIKGLALVDAAQPGWKQIVETKDLQRIAEPTAGQPLEDFSNTTAVTQAFQLKHIDPQRISQIIKPFLTEPGANTIPVEDQKLLIVTGLRRQSQENHSAYRVHRPRWPREDPRILHGPARRSLFFSAANHTVPGL